MSQKDPFAHYFHSWVPSGTASLLNFNNAATTQIFANKLDVCHTQKPARSVKTLFLKRLQTKTSHLSSNSWNRAFLWWALLIHTSFFHVAQRGLVFRHSLPAPKKLSRYNHSDYIFSLKNEKWLSNYDRPTEQVGWNLPKPSHCLQRPAHWREPSWPLHRAGLHSQYSKDYPNIFHLGGRPKSALNWWLDSCIYQAQVCQVTLRIWLKCETKIVGGLIKYWNLIWQMVAMFLTILWVELS